MLFGSLLFPAATAKAGRINRRGCHRLHPGVASEGVSSGKQPQLEVLGRVQRTNTHTPQDDGGVSIELDLWSVSAVV